MPAIAEPTQDLDLFILEDLDFDGTPKCDNQGCDNDATHLITCPCGEGTEYVCATCLTQIYAEANASFLAGILRFNRSCQHAAHVKDCSVKPI